MSQRNSGVFLFLMLFVFVFGSLLFLFGFFPDAYVEGDYDQNDSFGTQRPTAVKGFNITPPKSQYEQIILMIVDALSHSFVNPSDSMPFVHKNRCDLIKLRVAIPTVTMPRIKSLMTGTLSNFVDIIRNLGETEQLSDSLLHVLNKHNRIINFAGDRTWTGLFPSEFTRQRANMDSFFVHDFYEGDRQVVETMRKEIDEQDWSFLILHFLGFDHIGHVEGSNSPKIWQKLQEMDNVISEIFKHKYFENRLLLVTGDHGMRIGGGHGGSTEEELTVPLLFFNKKCNKEKYKNTTKEYNQIDLTATLAILMSVEIPKPSIGQLIPELLQNFSQEERLYAYYYNSYHLMHKAALKYGEKNNREKGYGEWFENAEIAHKDFLEARQKGLPGYFYYEQALKNYQRVSEMISNRMSESLVKFDYGLISVGFFLTTTATVYTVIILAFAENRQMHCGKSDLIFNITLWIVSFVIALILNMTSQELDLISANSFQRNCLFIASFTIAIFISLSILREIQKLILPLPTAARLKRVWTFPKPLLAAFLMTVFLLGSSSFIEFEHRSWHYLGVSCLFWLIVRNLQQEFHEEPDKFSGGKAFLLSFLRKNSSSFMLTFTTLSILRFLSALNFTSNRRWTPPWLQVFKAFCLSLFFVGSLVFLWLRLRKFLTPHQRKASIGIAISIILFRCFQGKVLPFPNGKFGCIAALCLFWVFVLMTCCANLASLLSNDGRRFERLLRNFFICSIWLTALLHQNHNVVLLPCLIYILEYAYNFCDNLKLYMREPYKERYKLACKTIMTIFITNMFFFYQGNSNSLATIDLNPGYIGQSTYNPVIVAIFVTLNTYSAPIIGFLYFALHMLANESRISFSLNSSSSPKKYFNTLSENENLSLVISLYTAATLLPVAFYLGLMIIFRYHLFIYSVFAPKAFYECYRVVVFFLVFCIFYIFRLISK